MLDDKTILITGGTGSFGNEFVYYILTNYKPRKVIIYSRDEYKQYIMRQKFAEHAKTLRFFLGDVRDKDRLHRAFRGVDYVVHAAALKQIETISKEITKRPDAVQLILLNAPPLLDMVGTVLGAHFLMDQAVLAKSKLAAILEEKGVGTDDKKAYKEFLKDNEEAAFYHNKVQTAIHFAYRALPTVSARAAAIRSGEKARVAPLR